MRNQITKSSYGRLLFLLLSLIACLTFPAKGQITFQQTFQAPYMNGGTYVDVTSDNGFIVTGQHQSSGAGGCDIYVFRRDACGNLIWFNTYGGAGDDGGMCIRPTADGGFIASGLAQLGLGNYDCYLMKLDAAGTVEWFQDYGGGNDDRGLQVQATADGGYIMSGHTTSFGAGGWDAFLVKTDAMGNTQWTRTYGGGGNDYGNYVEQTPDGGYIIMGSTSSFGAEGWDLWMIKTNANGNIQWNKTYGGVGNEGEHWHTKGVIASDGNYVMASYTSSFGAGSNDVILLKTDTTGAVLWAKTYGGTGDDQHRFIRQTADDGFIMTGFSTSFGFGGNDYYLLKTKPNGDLEWSYVYGGGGAEKAMGVQQASDGGYVMSGNATSFAPPGPGELYDAYIVKTDSMGIVGCHQDTAFTIVSTITLTVNSPLPLETSAGMSVSATPIVIAYTPAPQVLCLDCDVSFANFVYCDNGLTVNYIDSSICATGWYWDFGDGTSDTIQNPVHTYASPGTYNAMLIAENVAYGCDDTLAITITLDTFQVANFAVSNVCLGDTAVFTDLSDTTGVTITDYFWLFGDGDTSILQNPTHLYTVPGTYQTSLSVTLSKNNCTDTIVRTIIVHPRPVVNVTTDTACAKNPTQFMDSTQILTGSITGWQWSFGDGGTDIVANPAYNYPLGGGYIAQLVATSDMGCKDSATQFVLVHYTPVPLFSAPPVCHGNPTLFTDLSTIAGDAISSWLLEFGDGSTSPLQNSSHVYALPGSYNVELSATSNLGCVDSLTKIVVVNPLPVPAFLAPNTCLYDSVHFVDQSAILTDSIVNWLWDFDDGSSSTLSNPVHLYVNSGTYNVKLTLISDSGCVDSITIPLVIYDFPAASYTTTNVCAYDSSYFTDQSTIASGSVNQWTWLFGDGNSSTEQNPVHYYGAPGVYNHVFVAISNNGCVDTLQQPYEVYNAPVADFDFTIVCLNAPPTEFFDMSTILGDAIVAWAWDFGDGTFSTAPNPMHSYVDSGLFDVELVVTTANNCIYTINQWVLVNSLPNLTFTMDIAEGCAPLPIEFTNSTTNSIEYIWSFGDGNSGTTVNESHTYQDAGIDTTYTVYLAGLTLQGCRDTLFKVDTVTILPNPIAEFLTMPNPATMLHPYITFTNISSGNLDEPTVHKWDYGDGTKWTGFEQRHTFSNLDTGTYLVELIVENAHKCVDTFTTIVVIEDDFTIFVPTAFSPDGDAINEIFYPVGIGLIHPEFKFELLIFDRWGNMIFKTEDASQGWDGIANEGNKIAQSDVYVWVIYAEDISSATGAKHQYIGHVTLLR
ncbi:MAG: PKD domain-containing protein [Flavobacteriales bacterium]|nr:PKD domain-containing protein [Flavobacteriales bacterium]